MPYNITNIKTPTYSSLSNKTGSVGYTAPTGIGGNSPATTALNNKANNTSINTLSPAITSPSSQNLTGKAYYENMANVGNDAEKKAAQNWLNRNYGSIKKEVKTDANGNTTETHYNTPLINGVLTDTQKAAGDAKTKQLDTSYGGLIGRTTNLAQDNLNIGQSAKDIMAKYGQEYADIGQQGANAQAGYRTTGTSPVGEGNAAVVGQTTAAKQSAVAQGAQVAQTGIGQQLTAQNQATIGVGTAAALAKPYQQGYVLIDPTTGLPVQGGTTGSAAFKGGQIAGQEQAGQTAQNMQVANTAAKGIEGTIKQHLAQNPQLNPSDLTFANSISQWASGQQLGDPKYQTLANYLNEYISTLAPILGVGGDTTNLKTQIAQSFINAQASGESISQVLDSISKLADDKLANIISAGQGGGQVAGGGTSSGVLTWDNI